MSIHEYMAGVRGQYVRNGPITNRVHQEDWHEPFHGKIPELEVLLVVDPDLRKLDGSLRYEIHRLDNGLRFLADSEKPALNEGEQAVYPYHDEADMLLEIAQEVTATRGRHFDVIIDAFSGGGHSGLPMIHNGIAERLVGIDINPRAVHLAKANARLNGLHSKSSFSISDITKDGLPYPIAYSRLYIANPPFALKAKGADMDIMRDGGANGLALTMEYATQAVREASLSDVIIGIAYSRIGTDGSVELEGKLKELTEKYGGTVTMKLLKGQTLWRGFNGKKEQPNPMPITGDIFALKANPAKSEEVAAYRTAAQYHNEAGYDKLGYFSYVIQK